MWKNVTSVQLTHQQLHSKRSSIFLDIGDNLWCPSRAYPCPLMAWHHTVLKSTWLLSRFIHLATWLRDKGSLGLDWLGTRSSQIGHRWFSSKANSLVNNLWHGSLPDHVLRKLPPDRFAVGESHHSVTIPNRTPYFYRYEECQHF